MAIFNKIGKDNTTAKVLHGVPEVIPNIVKGIISNFKKEGYETVHQVSDNNSHDILVQKAGKLGVKTVIKVTVAQLKNNRINFKTTDYGLFNSKLDDEALKIAELIASSYSDFSAPKISTLKGSQPAPASKPSKPRLGGSSGKGSW